MRKSWYELVLVIHGTITTATIAITANIGDKTQFGNKSIRPRQRVSSAGALLSEGQTAVAHV